MAATRRRRPRTIKQKKIDLRTKVGRALKKVTHSGFVWLKIHDRTGETRLDKLGKKESDAITAFLHAMRAYRTAVREEKALSKGRSPT